MNIFEKNRQGTPVVRPEDLVVLRVETVNMKIVPGTDIRPPAGMPGRIAMPRLCKMNKLKPAYLILHFPPQSFAEETFFESAPKDFDDEHKMDTDSADGESPRHPVKARIANESRLVFVAPNNFEIEYSLASILQACKEWPLKVSAAANGYAVIWQPGGLDSGAALVTGGYQFSKSPELVIRIPLLVKPDITTPGQQDPIDFNARVTAGAVANALRIAAAGDAATLRMRAGLSGNAAFYTLDTVPPKPDVETQAINLRMSVSNSELTLFPEMGAISSNIAGNVMTPNINGYYKKVLTQPEMPDATTTSIEMPWRLILSPHSGGRWRHAADAVYSDKTTHTELWHSRLVTPHDDKEIEPPYPDAKRTTRAIWALSGEGGEKAKKSDGNYVSMQSNWHPSVNLPTHDVDNPFRTTLDNSDRYQIAHLSSNFKNSFNYVPEPIDTNLMMLSAMGGWLDSRGAWEPPGGYSVEEWAHRAAMGRDHYVRVVYRGFLFPFGHRVSLVKVSERKFHNNVDGNPAWLRQRLFIVVREKERTYDGDLFRDAIKNSPLEEERYSFARKFPFSRVGILTETTPDLDNPNLYNRSNRDYSGIKKPNSNAIIGQSMFWPHVNGNPFLFQCAATDLDGRRILFDLPMIFVENTLAAPYGEDGKPNYGTAATNAIRAMEEFKTKFENGKPYNTAKLNWQRVALAPSLKSGDTSAQVEQMTFGGFAEGNNESLVNYSEELTIPLWAPQVEEIKARIGAIANLSGAQESHTLEFNKKYLRMGINPGNGNKGEVFADIKSNSSGPSLDFSSQGDKSGGFIQPNLKPAALSRMAGPVMSDVDAFIAGDMPQGAGFDAVSGLPMPLLFGCIPLGELIDEVGDIVGNPLRVPKFVCEAGSKFASFFNDLDRLYEFVANIPEQSVNIAKGALYAFKDTLNDLKDQAEVCTESVKTAITAKLNATSGKIDALISALGTVPFAVPEGSHEWPGFQFDAGGVRNAVNELQGAANVALPAGFKQSISNAVNKLNTLLDQLDRLKELANYGNELWAALNAIVGNEQLLIAMLATGEGLAGSLETLKSAIKDFREKFLDKTELIDGAQRNSIRSALNAVEDIIGKVENFNDFVDMLTGEELTIRFDWNPEISNWPREGKPLFRANDKKGLLVAVEAKVRKNGSSSPKISVNCGLKHFDLVLIAPISSFLELNFEKIEFSVDSASKMDVDVKLSDIKFVGVLSFVETLRDLIPLDGFSDPPYLDITPKGIDAGFDISLPTVACGMFSMANISLGAGFTVPFIGQPLSVRFNFCTREKPFLLTVSVLGGGGFFGVTIDPKGVQMLEAAFEFGAAISVNFGVASGGVYVMAGIYYRMEMDNASLTGYFRMGGNVSVLGLINASIELYLAMTYEFSTGKCVGKASLTVKVSIAFFSTKVTISHERKFAGSNGDPTMRQMLGYKPELTLEAELAEINEKTQYAWRDYLEAFV